MHHKRHHNRHHPRADDESLIGFLVGVGIGVCHRSGDGISFLANSDMSELANTFMTIMQQQPLSLALCVMNLLLLWYCFRLTSSFTKARSEISTMIVQWQKETQAIMANCVSKEVMEMILAALERDRALYRAMLPAFGAAKTDEQQ